MNLILFELVSVIGGLGTFLFAQQKGIGVVKASALLSLIVGIATIAFYDSEIIKQLTFTFCGATFIGMTSPNMLNKFWIGIASLIFGAIFYFFAYQYEGYGGGLGTTACISTMSTFGITQILKKKKGSTRIP